MKKTDKGRLPPFVPLLKDTLNSPAWRAMSHGARSLYIALKCNYNRNAHNNGRIYLANRRAAKEIGSSPNQIVRWFRELQFYGFIVMQKPGGLGVYGKGQAPRWRLTELGYMRDPPTRDFLRWDGIRFHDRKKQKPVTENRNTPLRKTVTLALRKTVTLCGTSVTENRNKEDGESVTENRNKSILTTWVARGWGEPESKTCSQPPPLTTAQPDGKPAWQTPHIEEITALSSSRGLLS
jgi:hypothetical protein